MTGPTTTQDKPSLIERPADVLEGDAADTWQAYNAMETTKQRHFELLELLDNKKKNYNIDPTDADQRLLECLLADHDQQVKSCLLYTSPSPRDRQKSRMPSSA